MNNNTKPIKLEQPYSVIHMPDKDKDPNKLGSWSRSPNNSSRITRQNLDDAMAVKNAFKDSIDTGNSLQAPEGDSNDYFLKAKNNIVSKTNDSKIGDFLNNFHGMDFFKSGVPEIEKGLKGTGYDMGPSANIVDNLKEAVDKGDAKEVENIIEEHPEESKEALPEDTPIQKEAEQITDDTDKRNDEVNNEAVEDFVENPSSESELSPVVYPTEQVTDPNVGSIPEDLPENNRPLDNLVLNNYDDDKDRGELVQAIASDNDNKVEEIAENNPELVENMPELDGTPLEEEAQQITDDTDKKNDEINNEAIDRTQSMFSGLEQKPYYNDLVYSDINSVEFQNAFGQFKNDYGEDEVNSFLSDNNLEINPFTSSEATDPDFSSLPEDKPVERPIGESFLKPQKDEEDEEDEWLNFAQSQEEPLESVEEQLKWDKAYKQIQKRGEKRKEVEDKALGCDTFDDWKNFISSIEDKPSGEKRETKYATAEDWTVEGHLKEVDKVISTINEMAQNGNVAAMRIMHNKPWKNRDIHNFVKYDLTAPTYSNRFGAEKWRKSNEEKALQTINQFDVNEIDPNETLENPIEILPPQVQVEEITKSESVPVIEDKLEIEVPPELEDDIEAEPEFAFKLAGESYHDELINNYKSKLHETEQKRLNYLLQYPGKREEALQSRKYRQLQKDIESYNRWIESLEMDKKASEKPYRVDESNIDWSSEDYVPTMFDDKPKGLLGERESIDRDEDFAGPDELPAIRPQDYHKELMVAGNTDLVPYEENTDSDEYNFEPKWEVLESEVEELPEETEEEKESKDRKRRILKGLKNRKIDGMGGGHAITPLNVPNENKTLLGGGPRAGIGNVSMGGGTSGHGSMSPVNSRRTYNAMNTGKTGGGSMPVTLGSGSSKVIQPSRSFSNGSLSSGSFGLMSKNKSNGAFSSKPLSLPNGESRSVVEGVKVDSIAESGKNALIERLKTLLDKLSPEQRKQLGFSPKEYDYQGERLEDLDGYTIQKLLEKVEKLAGTF